jgi:hypothetical protein
MYLILALALSLLNAVQSPMPVHIEPIAYPLIARLSHTQGTAIANVQLNKKGEVVDVSTSGSPMLSDEVNKSLKGWKFQCDSCDRANIIFEFKLEGKPRDANPETFITFDLPGRVTVVTQPPVCDHCADAGPKHL